MSDLDPSELYQMISQGLIDAAPADWMEAGAIYLSVGKVGDGEFYAILEDGEKQYLRVESDVPRALRQLRHPFPAARQGRLVHREAGPAPRATPPSLHPNTADRANPPA